MWLNWESLPFAEDKAGMAWMRDNWNMTVLRIAMGVEPAGAYLSDPKTAKQQVETIIAHAEELGVYVIVDWHAHEAQLHQAEAVAFFREMSAAHGASPNVLWETFNEPQMVDWTTVVKPYHEAVLAAIRENDPDNVVILGTPQWGQSVDKAAADPVTGDANLMYTLHFYSCTHDQHSRSIANIALARHLPLFVTEWGATDADGGRDGKVCLEEADLWNKWMNNAGISWTAWKLDTCSDSSCYFTGSVPTSGGWTDAMMGGHGPYVRDHIIQ
jgi:endoglucanase